MSVQDSRSDYARRMHRVLEHIDRHLDQPLDLETLSGVAHFSAFHFHRLFSAWMGETLADYVRRRRLEIGALRLATQPSSSVLRIAIAVGFNSGEAFTRAFRARFNTSPTAWRSSHRKNRQAKRKDDQDATLRSPHHEASFTPTREALMKVTLIDRPATHVVYLRHVGPYGEPVSTFWQESVYPWMVTNDLLGCPRYGISHDDPSITSAERCRYDACVEVAPGWQGAGTYHETTMPGGRCAVTRFEGTVDEINAAWASLLGDWIPSSGLELDTRPFFEYYGPGTSYDPATGVFDCDLCIPVARRLPAP
ncbi:MAG: AraC family transcriptional regulator [bacterium]